MNLLELFVAIMLRDDGYKKGLEEAESNSEKSGGKISKVFGGVMKAVGAGIAACAAGVSALTKQAVEAYADYEQLVGGVETLFGAGGQSIEDYANSVGKSVDEVAEEYKALESAQTTVLQNAADAYKTAGLSANEYMETATSFAAALTNSLNGDTVAAADAANKAIIDMADNANKMGSSMESIQNAYNGFSKQNYTMLDNLKLGYGGTKEEMKRLLADAEKMPEAMGRKFDLENYADVVEAIHVVQENMGIAGTTSKEAMTTISGSLGMVKGAWTNLVAGLADDNADMGKLIDNLLNSLIGEVDETGNRVGGLINNIMPRVMTALEGVGSLIEEAVPILLEQLPVILEEFLPSLLESGANMLTAVIDGIVGNIDQITTVVLQLIELLANTLLANLPTIISAGMNLLISLAQGFASMIPEMLPTVIDVILEVVNVLTNPDNLVPLVEAALAIILALANGLIEALPQLIEALPVIIMNLLDAFVALAPELYEAGLQLIINIGIGLVEAIPLLVKQIPVIVVAIVNAFENLKKRFLNIGKNIVEGIKEGIKNAWDSFVSWLSGLVGDLVEHIKDMLGIHSPSRVFAEIGSYMAQGMQVGWQSDFPAVKSAISDDLEFEPTEIRANSSYDDEYGAGRATVFNQTINVNERISTPDELAQKIRIESRYGLMAGGALG